jgi:signal transduction histidine kinase/HAMP domain-containing protein
MASRTFLQHPFRSIRGRLVLAFVGISALMAGFGAFAIHNFERSDELVVLTYKQPLMSVNFAHRSHLAFAWMDRALARSRLEPKASAAAELERLYALFREDIAVARLRSMSGRAEALVDEIAGLVDAWTALARQAIADPDASEMRDLDALHMRVTERFDVLIDVVAGDGFSLRQQGLSASYELRLATTIAFAAVLLLTLATAVIIGRSILRPVGGAVAVAERIAAGDLNVAMPHAGTEETGKLFAAMSVMQSSLRAKMERETALRESAQTRLVDAIESASEGVIVLDTEDRIVVANSQFRRLLPGIDDWLAPGREFGQALAEATRIGLFDASFGDVETQRARYLKTREQTTPFVRENKLADGRTLRVSRDRTRDGGSVVIWSDITDLKARETTLDQARAQAEAASRAKTSFLANMSHELRTPLNGVIGLAEVMAKEMHGPLGGADYLTYANNILDSGRHLLEIINDVLDLSKSEAGKLEIRLREMNIEDEIESCYRMMMEQCRRAEIHFAVAKDAVLPVIDADPARVRQILLNLLSNAVKFTPAGGRVELAVRIDGDRDLVLHVSDTGIGMRSEDIPIALEPFSQIDSSLSRRYEGTGLGLPLTKRLVELHGGTLAIRSAPGKGTVVTVRLPLRQADAMTEQGTAAIVA